jgi:benzoylformate decarboxylase
MYSSDVSNRVKRVYSTEKLAHEFTAALDADGPTVIVVPTQPHQAHLG